jgi:signal transduction histidine kinase
MSEAKKSFSLDLHVPGFVTRAYEGFSEFIVLGYIRLSSSFYALLAPSKAVAAEELNYAQMTVALSLLCFFTSFLSFAYQTWRNQHLELFSTITVFVLLGLYYLSRSRYHRLAAWILSAVAYGVISTSLIQAPITDFAVVMYSTLGLFLGSLVLPPRHFYIFFVAAIAWYVVVFFAYWESLRVIENGQTVVYIIVLAILVAVTSSLRFSHLVRISNEIRLSDEIAGMAKLSAQEAESAKGKAEVSARAAELAQKEAELAKEEAVKANEIKSAFLASVSHELRTPLNAIIGFSEIMLVGRFGALSDKQKLYMGRVVDNGKHLLGLINDVLDISKIASGSLTLYLQKDLDLKQIFESLEATTSTLIAEKPVSLKFELNEIPKAMLDRQRILQIALNLLSNAAKFTAVGSIEFCLDYLPDTCQLRFRVTDTGMGIAEDQQHKVFVAFEQSASGLRLGGTGLGMPISLALAEAHGGKLYFESKLGVGTTFTCLLPLTPPDEVVAKFYDPTSSEISDDEDDEDE